MASQTCPKSLKILYFWKVGLFRVHVTPPWKGNSKSWLQFFSTWVPLQRGIERIYSACPIWPGELANIAKVTSWPWVYSGGHSPSTPQHTPRLWPNVLLDNISQRSSVHRSSLALISLTRGRREFLAKIYQKIGKVWEAISPKRGRNFVLEFF